MCPYAFIAQFHRPANSLEGKIVLLLGRVLVNVDFSPGVKPKLLMDNSFVDSAGVEYSSSAAPNKFHKRSWCCVF